MVTSQLRTHLAHWRLREGPPLVLRQGLGLGLVLLILAGASNRALAQERALPQDAETAHTPVALQPALDQLSPSEGDWNAEVWNGQLGGPLKKLRDVVLEAPIDLESAAPKAWSDLLAPDSSGVWLRGEPVQTQDGVWHIQRGAPDLTTDGQAAGDLGIAEGWLALRKRMQGPLRKTDWHVEGLQVTDATHAQGTLRLQWNTNKQGVRGTMHSIWSVQWQRTAERILWQEIIELESHWVELRTEAQPAFVDRSSEIFPKDLYENQLAPGIDHWRERLDSHLGTGLLGHQGLAVGDINGDGREDVYICEPGGLPNRLLVQNPDGTTRDVAKEMNVDVLDYTSSALLVDLDGDRDKDLVLCTGAGLRVFEFRAGQRFRLVYSKDGKDCTSLAAADVDADGLVDLYVCRYASPYESTGLPFPYHDAENGAPNWMLKNLSGFAFEDVSDAWGLSRSSRRFSFSASFEDYDQDGDLDLYVANDFGRNSLYQKQGERFVNVADQDGVQDYAAGMGVTWGDFDRDGWMDLYVSNMDSNAGQRITWQGRFLAGAEEDVLNQYQSHARGSSTYLWQPESKRFLDATVASNARRSLWAWGGLSLDLDLDGNLDLVVPNGFITGESTTDL